MKNLNITAEAVKQAFKNAGKDGKQVLTDLFGKQVALYDNITERVKSFEDACQVLGISTNVPDVKGLPRKHQKAIVANYKLIIIAEALNEGWKPNWQDSDECKYYPWFDMRNPAGVGYSNTLIRLRMRMRISGRGFALNPMNSQHTSVNNSPNFTMNQCC